MDDEKLAVQLNLNDFESIFELKTNEMSEEVRLKKEAGKRLLTTTPPPLPAWSQFFKGFSINTFSLLSSFEKTRRANHDYRKESSTKSRCVFFGELLRFFSNLLRKYLTYFSFFLYFVFYLVIAKRRIGFSPKFIKQHIDNSDISELSSEFAELLLKFVPTKEEVGSNCGFVVFHR